jgi:hypothetical protein
MVWFFERGEEILRIETAHNRTAGEYVLTLHFPGSTERVERFADEAACQERLETLERQLRSDRWRLRLAHPLPSGEP